MNSYACVFALCFAVSLLGASILAKSISNLASHNAHHIDRGAW